DGNASESFGGVDENGFPDHHAERGGGRILRRVSCRVGRRRLRIICRNSVCLGAVLRRRGSGRTALSDVGCEDRDRNEEQRGGDEREKFHERDLCKEAATSSRE